MEVIEAVKSLVDVDEVVEVVEVLVDVEEVVDVVEEVVVVVGIAYKFLDVNCFRL